MGILCKLFGHKHDLNRGLPRIRPTGWELDYNANYIMVEYESFCERCCKQVPIGVYSKPKDHVNVSDVVGE